MDFFQTYLIYELIKYNTESSCELFIQFPPMVTFFKTTIQCHNQDINIDNNPQILVRFPNFTWMCVYVFSSVLFITCVDLCNHHYSQDTEQFYY